MPELPEVETVRATLEHQIIGEKIIDIKVLYSGIIEGDVESFKNSLIGQTLRKMERYGKYLFFIFDEYSNISHLRMEGKYFLKDKNDPIVDHEHIIFYFESGRTLRYHDTRKFGTMHVVPLTTKEELLNVPEIKKLGKEANDPTFTKEELYNLIHNKNNPIKTSLLDQSIIAGLGNIYVDEVLFLCKINPLTKSNMLTIHDCYNILKASFKVLHNAILAGGTTIRSYTSSLGVTGRFQLNLYVHTKENTPCQKCGTSIVKTTVGGRGTYFCPNCQDYKGKVIGITGGIATGKSIVSSYIKELGYEVVDSDVIAHEVLNKNETIEEIKKEFGLSVFADGVLSRKLLGNVVFNDEEKRMTLNNIIHPVVKKEILNKIYNRTTKPLFIDVPLLFESGFDELVNEVICVYANKKVQLVRLIERDNIDLDLATKKISSQLSIDEKASKSHYIIDNSKDLCYTYEQINKIIDKINK